ncbi:MAG TPA: nuclear transport factor 2 family protein [Rhizomicrobium sp.]|jgi:ketosteroid isomerase-like protein|nr:nuclear transport factor 2 family protein [Rhizomicrobium sp.]
MSQEASNKALMLSVFAAFKDGNLEPLFAAISPDVVWKASAPPEFFRFGGTYRGIEGMHEFTALLSSRYHFTRFAPKIVTATGDQVWGVFEAEALHQPSGRYVRFDISLRWTVKAGKIADHQCFFDTAGVLMQQGELTVAA